MKQISAGFWQITGWYLLAKHPEVEAKLITELQTVLAGRAPNLSDLRQLRYTEWIILETMRLYPPAWIIARTMKNDCKIGAYHVKRGNGLLAVNGLFIVTRAGLATQIILIPNAGTMT